MYDWKNVYGSPLDVSGKVTKRMNENPEIASLWKGRILMKCTAEKTEKPKLFVKLCEPEEVNDAAKYQIPRRFCARVYINQLICTPEKNEKYTISVRCADKEWESGMPKVAKAKYNRFNEIVNKDEDFFELPYQSIKDIGTIMIYLNKDYKLKKKKRICFWRGDIMQFTNPNAEMKWIDLDPDLAIGEVKEHYKAGIVGLKVSLHDVTAEGPIDWGDYPTWAKPPPKRPTIKKIRVFCW